MLTQVAAYQQMISINLQNILAAKWKQLSDKPCMSTALHLTTVKDITSY